MTEREICRELIKWRDLNIYRYPCLKLFHHVPNEGKRKPWVAKSMGILAGLPDYHMPVKSLLHIGFWLEIKAKGKKPTDKQIAMMESLSEQGHYVTWEDNLSDAIEITEWYCHEVENNEQ